MNRWIVSLLAVLVVALGAAPKAEAQVSAAGLLGYGIDFEDGDLNPFGFTLGGRGGYTLSNHVYVGGAMVFHIGGKEDRALPVGGSAEFTARMLQIGGEVGYDIGIGDALTVRPYLGLGINAGFFSSTFDVAGSSMKTSNTESDFFLNVGGTVLYDLTDSLFLGGDVRISHVVSDPEGITGLVFMATAGFRFGGGSEEAAATEEAGASSATGTSEGSGASEESGAGEESGATELEGEL